MIIGVLLILIGLIGCFLPILPGPSLAFVALLLLQLTEEPPFTFNFLFLWGIITAGTIAADYFIPPLATKKFGGDNKGVFGSIVGLILGVIFFPPFGIIFGPMIGAYLGELISGKSPKGAIRPALGSFIGFLTSTMLKFGVTCVMTYYFVIAIIDSF